jgi:hypothetical protein
MISHSRVLDETHTRDTNTEFGQAQIKDGQPLERLFDCVLRKVYELFMTTSP